MTSEFIDEYDPDPERSLSYLDAQCARLLEACRGDPGLSLYTALYYSPVEWIKEMPRAVRDAYGIAQARYGTNREGRLADLLHEVEDD